MDDFDFLEDDDQDEIEDLDFPIDPYDDMLIDEPEWIDDSQDNCVLDQEFIDNHLNIVPCELLHNFPFIEDDVDAITDYELFSKGFGYLDENKVNKDELSNVAYTGDFNDLINKPDYPDVSEYVKKDTTELENYPLTSSLSSVAFSGDYDDLSDKPTIPTKTSDLTNDSGFITKSVNDLTNYPLTSSLSSVAFSGDYDDLDDKPTIPTKTSDITNDSGYITKDVNDLTYYTKTADLPSIPTKTSDLTNDSGFITKSVNDLTNYTLTSNLSTVATSGNYNDLTNKPTIPTVPTNVSAFTNDSGYITNSVNNLTNYTTTSSLNSLLANKENVIVSGSNTNGNYEKFDNGMMIEWGVAPLTDDFTTASGASGIYRPSSSPYITFPVEFISTPSMELQAQNQIQFAYIGSLSNVGCYYWPLSIGSATGKTGYIYWIAIGKWK